MGKQNTAVNNGKNDAVNTANTNGDANGVDTQKKVIKGVDLLLIDNLRDMIEKGDKQKVKNFFELHCKLKDDGDFHITANDDYIKGLKTFILSMTKLDANAFDDDSNNLFKKVLTTTATACFRLKAKTGDKSSELNSWRSVIQNVGVMLFIRQFLLAYMLHTNKSIYAYNDSVVLVDIDTAKQIKQKANFELWQTIRRELGLTTDDGDTQKDGK